MKRNHTKIKHLLPEILVLKSQGKTHREIGWIYGLTKDQVKRLIWRYNRDLREGRKAIQIDKDRNISLSPRQELEYENQRLQMEVDLLKSFLQAAGRR